jgi:cytochrome c oxidase subunit 2
MTKYLDLTRYMGLPVLASEHGKDVDSLMVYVHWLMALLFIGWLGYFAYAIFRFRKVKNPKADYVGIKGPLSTWVEVAVALVEGVLLIGFAIPLWAKVVDKFPSEKEATVLRVTAEQFTWNSRYPGADGIFGKQDVHLVAADNPFGLDKNDPNGKDDVVPPLNEIHVQVGKPVLVYLTSKDVIHSFKILPFRVTQDAIPGMILPVHFTPTIPGKYQITCAQLCGNGHSSMRGLITVDTAEEYAKWLAAKSKGGGAVNFE